jgi:hypothetical protein
MDTPPADRLDRAIADALDAYEGLTELAEDIDDEWTYVTDLAAAWRGRFEAVAASRGAEATDPTVTAAIATAIDEIGLITDPHRAIDWLSTFPQLVLLALGEAA